MKHLDLFSGIGGFALAARWMGWQTIGFVEIDPFCQKILRKHWPGVQIESDIKQVTADTFRERPDIVTGGFPCQPFSVAGDQRGESDDRYLWPKMVSVIKKYKPRWVLGENVAGIIPLALDNVLLDLEAAGYEAWPIVIPACAVNAPHRRERVWIVGYSNSERSGASGSDSVESGTAVETISASEQSESLAYAASPQWSIAEDRNGRAVLAGRGEEATTDAPGEQTSELREYADCRQYSEPSRQSRGSGLPNNGSERPAFDGFPTQPPVCRRDDGLPVQLDGLELSVAGNRVARLTGLGNAIVPQVAYEIFQAIASTEGIEE